MTLNRRSFMTSMAFAAGAPAILTRLLMAAETKGDWTATFEQTADKIKPYIQCGDDPTWRFAVHVYQQCVLGKVSPPVPPFKHEWLRPGGCYIGQWIWDTMFVVDLLSVMPDQRETIRGVFQNYWDFQDRWNAKMPEYRHDMIACVMWGAKEPPEGPAWARPILYSQIPILGWGLERVYQRTGDMELVKSCLAPLERFNEWYWRERDVTDVGLISVGSYSGVVQDARFETFDFECNLDDLKLTPHPKRKGPNEGAWYGDICVPGNTAYLLMGEQSLARLAKLAGDNAMAERRQKRIQCCITAMREYMWDQPTGTFLAVHRDTLKKIPVATIGSWVPLMTEVPTKEMAARMAEMLATDNWMTPLPVPTVGRHDHRWESGRMWRGDVWPPTNYQIAVGLARYGYKDLATKIVDATVANAMKVGINERYDSITGKPTGVPGLGMSCTLLTMVLDGMSKNYTATVVKSGTPVRS